MKLGNFGDHKSVSNNIIELRISIGLGYRVYYTQKDDEIIVLLVGDDIKKANEILKELENE